VTEYSIAELMAVCLSREIGDGEVVLQGLYSPLPMLACLLAKKTHAPGAIYINVSDSIDSDPDFLPFSSADPKLHEGAVGIIPLCETFDLAQQGRLDLIFLGAAQIDQYGNTNLSVIGDYHRPKVRLPGGAASSFLCAVARRTVIWVTRHSPRVFVERVDFITGQGFLDGPGRREELGLPGEGPKRVVTNLGVFGFDEETKRMRIESLHPGVSLEQVRENTSFELIVPEEVPLTSPPTEEQLELVRRMDPYGVREIEFRK